MKKNKTNKNSTENTKNNDAIEFQGTIEEALPAAMFRVICENDHSVLATLSGKLRVNNIRLVPGDSVTVAVSPYDLSRGRILWRH
jgi:translation initiation factor IF-1